MILTIDKTHELKGNGYLLGVDGENGSEQLIIKVENEALLDKWVYIEFEKDNGEKFTTERLSVVDGQIVYDIVNGLLPQGHVKVQVIFRDASGFVWKSFVRQFAVDKSLNACCNLPLEYPDFIGEAQKLLDGIEFQNERIDAFLSSDAETARVEAEAERQANETAREEAETARRTEFAGWSESMGSLNTYDKRLINLEEAGVGVLFDYQEDNSTAYSKAVPAKALPYAILNKVGGMTYKADGALTDTLVKSVGAYAIPEAVQALDGYGLGLDETCHNYIDFERKVFVQNVIQKVLNGSEYWNDYPSQEYRPDGAYCYRHNVYDSAVGLGYLICDKFAYKGYAWQDGQIGQCSDHFENQTKYFVTNIATLEGWKEWLASNPITIIYKLATSVETDISAYLTDNYIKVEPNGSVVFENDNGQAVPSEITFVVKK